MGFPREVLHRGAVESAGRGAATAPFSRCRVRSPGHGRAQSEAGEPTIDRRCRRWELVWLFVLAWTGLGSFIHVRNQIEWGMQHAWVEALGERGQMFVDESTTPEFADVGDVWRAPDGHLYGRNAPGTYLVAGSVYWLLGRLTGLSYASRFGLTASLITWLVTTLATALTMVLLARIGTRLTDSPVAGVATALAYGFGTLAFPYSGVPYQHQTAALFLVAAFAFGLEACDRTPHSSFDFARAGLCIGLVPLFSFATVPAALCVGFYLLSLRPLRRGAPVALGAMLGPGLLLAINARFYGGPLTTVYQASSDPEVTVVHVSVREVIERLWFYLGSPSSSVFLYSPILALAVVGLAAWPATRRREQLAIGGSALATLAHLLVVSGSGASQWGPRLVLPFVPLLCLGLCGFWLPGRLKKRPWQLLVGLVLVVSMGFSALGASGPTMYHHLSVYNGVLAYFRGWPNLMYDVPSSAFLLRPLAWPAGGAAIALLWRLRKSTRMRTGPTG